MTWPVHISPFSIANGTTIGLKSVKWGKQGFRRKAKTRKICPRPAHFSLRFLKSDRPLVRRFSGDAVDPVHSSMTIAQAVLDRIMTGVDQCPASAVYPLSLVRFCTSFLACNAHNHDSGTGVKILRNTCQHRGRNISERPVREGAEKLCESRF